MNKTIEEKIYKLMKENKIYGDTVDVTENYIAIEISWGDWKHEHLFFDWLMRDNIPELKEIKSFITEEDGSDCYSAIHYLFF